MKRFAILLAAALVLAGCTGKAPAQPDTTPENSQSQSSLTEESGSLSPSVVESAPTTDKALADSIIADIENPPVNPEHWFYLGNPMSIMLEYNSSSDKIKRVKAPVDISAAVSASEYSVYITPELTAIVHGGVQAQAPEVEVLISRDMGESWESTKLDLGGRDEVYYTKFIGFTTEQDGWIIMGGDLAVGTQHNYVYRTSDGGKTWQEVGNTNGQHARQFQEAGFLTPDIGFIAFSYRDDSIQPQLYRTEDGGKTWNPSEAGLTVPEGIEFDYAEPKLPVLRDGLTVLPVYLRNNKADPIFSYLYYVSTDLGKSWEHYPLER